MKRKYFKYIRQCPVRVASCSIAQQYRGEKYNSFN